MALATLEVILEATDGGFVTIVNSAGDALAKLEGQANITVKMVNQASHGFHSGIRNVAAWAITIGEASRAVRDLNDVFGLWVEKLVEVNSRIQQTTVLLGGFSDAATNAGRLADGLKGVNAMLDMATHSPHSFEALQTAFVRMKTVGIDPLKGAMQALTDAIGAFGGDDTRFNRASYAIQEMGGRGVLSLQNLRRQLGQDIPDAVKLMAQSMNMTVAELDDKTRTGTLDSINALKQMLHEAERVHGGAALRLMNTFQGQVAVFKTSMMRLAMVAGGTAEGMNPKESSFDRITADLQKLNDALLSPRMQAGAVTVNAWLNSMAESAAGLINVLPALADHITAIGRAVELLATVAGTMALGKLLEFAGAGWVGLATNAGRLVASLRGVPTRLRLLGEIMTGLGGIALTLGERVAGFGVTLVASITGVEEATVAATGLAGALTAVTAGFAIIAFPAAILAGIAAIIYSMKGLQGQADLTTDAINRMRQGDVTPANQAKTLDELKAFKDRLALVNSEIAKARSELAGGQSAGALPAIGGGGGTVPVDTNKLFEQAIKAHPPHVYSFGRFGAVDVPSEGTRETYVSGYLKRLIKQKAQLESQTQQIEALIKGAHARLIEENNRSFVDAESRRFSDESAPLHRAFEKREEAINGQENAPSQDKAALHKKTFSERKAAVEGYYRSYFALISKFIAEERRMRDQAAQAGNNAEAARYDSALQHFKEFYDKKKTIEADAMKNYGVVITTSSDKSRNAALKTSENLMRSLEERAASLQGTLDGTGSTFGKVSRMFAEGGKLWVYAGTDIETILKKDAKRVDDLKASVKDLQAQQKAMQVIDSGVTRADAEVEAYTERLDNPNLSQGAVQVAISTDRMRDALAKFIATLPSTIDVTGTLAERIKAVGDAASAAARKTNQAIAEMRDSELMREVLTGAREAHTEMVNTLPPEKQAEMRHKDRLKAITDQRNQLMGLITSGNVSSDEIQNYRGLLAKLYQEQQDVEASYRDRTSRLGSREAKPGENAVSQLASRVEDLKAQLAGGDSVLARWNELIHDSGQKYAGAASKIREYAAEVDKLQAQIKTHNESNTALKSLQKNASQQAGTLAGQQEMSGRGRLLSVERTILEFRQRQVTELAKFKADSNNAANPALMANAKSAFETSTNDEAANQLTKFFDQQISADKRATESHVQSLAQRRAANLDLLQQERNDINAQVAALNVSDSERMTLEQKADAYIAAERKKLDQQTENSFQKLGDKWGDVTDNIINTGSQMFSKLSDGLADLVTKGKLDWTSLADWAIQEMARMAAQAALSPLMKLLGSLGQSLVGNIFGSGDAFSVNSGPATAWDSVGPVSSDGWDMIAGHHKGGFVGTEPTFHRRIHAHMAHHVFGKAHKFHTGGVIGGLNPGEVPIIAQQGEAVFTAGQIAAIGTLNHNYGFVEQALEALVNAAGAIKTQAAMPPANVPAGYYNAFAQGGAVTGGAPPVTINVTNQSSQPLQAMSGTPSFDGEQMVIDVVVRNVQNPGPLRDAIKTVAKQS